MNRICIKGENRICVAAAAKKIIVIVNLYYFDTWQRYMKYIENIPRTIRIIITSSNLELLHDIKKYVESKQYSNIRVKDKCNRGRDISALLVACNREITDSDYFCFVHDKKSKNEAQKADSEMWIDNLWGNMLYSYEYVNEIINLLYKNKRLGLLLPPTRVGKSFTVDDGWGNNYNNVIELLNKMNLQYTPNENEKCECQGTMFWAKTEALLPILDIKWSYSDFPEEPLAADGEINHAIERSLEYIAKSKGFDVAMIYSDCYWKEEIDYYICERQETYDLIFKNTQCRTLNQLTLYSEDIERRLNFWDSHEKVYIYGARTTGRECFCFAGYKNRIVAGFIVTSKIEGEDKFLELPIWSIDEIEINDTDGVVIATSKKYHADIIETLKTKGVKSYFIWEDMYLWSV